MTTEELINIDFDAFSVRIAELDGRSCERHARDLFHRLGASVPFEDYVQEMARAAVRFQGLPEDQFVEMYRVSEKHFPGVPKGYGILARLIALTVRMISSGQPAADPSGARKRSTDRNPGRPG